MALSVEAGCPIFPSFVKGGHSENEPGLGAALSEAAYPFAEKAKVVHPGKKMWRPGYAAYAA